MHVQQRLVSLAAKLCQKSAVETQSEQGVPTIKEYNDMGLNYKSQEERWQHILIKIFGILAESSIVDLIFWGKKP